MSELTSELKSENIQVGWNVCVDVYCINFSSVVKVMWHVGWKPSMMDGRDPRKTIKASSFRRASIEFLNPSLDPNASPFIASIQSNFQFFFPLSTTSFQFLHPRRRTMSTPSHSLDIPDNTPRAKRHQHYRTKFKAHVDTIAGSMCEYHACGSFTKLVRRRQTANEIDMLAAEVIRESRYLDETMRQRHLQIRRQLLLWREELFPTPGGSLVPADGSVEFFFHRTDPMYRGPAGVLDLDYDAGRDFIDPLPVNPQHPRLVSGVPPRKVKFGAVMTELGGLLAPGAAGAPPTSAPPATTIPAPVTSVVVATSAPVVGVSIAVTASAAGAALPIIQTTAGPSTTSGPPVATTAPTTTTAPVSTTAPPPTTTSAPYCFPAMVASLPAVQTYPYITPSPMAWQSYQYQPMYPPGVGPSFMPPPPLPARPLPVHVRPSAPRWRPFTPATTTAATYPPDVVVTIPFTGSSTIPTSFVTTLVSAASLTAAVPITTTPSTTAPSTTTPSTYELRLAEACRGKSISEQMAIMEVLRAEEIARIDAEHAAREAERESRKRKRDEGDEK